MIKYYDGNVDLQAETVRFTADWCLPCKQYAPLFERAADKHDATWFVVDVDEYPEVAREFGVRSIPAVFVDGQRIEDHMTWVRSLA